MLIKNIWGTLSHDSAPHFCHTGNRPRAHSRIICYTAKMSDTPDSIGVPPPVKTVTEKPVADDVLRQILHELKIINHRERWRTASGFVHTIITFAPMILFLYGMWFAYSSADNIIDQIVDRAVGTFMRKGLPSTNTAPAAVPADWQKIINNLLPPAPANR